MSEGEGGGCVCWGAAGVMPDLWKAGWLVKVGIRDRSGGIVGSGRCLIWLGLRGVCEEEDKCRSQGLNVARLAGGWRQEVGMGERGVGLLE